MKHPPCSPKLAPNDISGYWRHPKKCDNSTTALKAIPQQELQKCFKQWQHHLAKCIAAQGEYFKGDPSHKVDCNCPGMLAVKSFWELYRMSWPPLLMVWSVNTSLFRNGNECVSVLPRMDTVFSNELHSIIQCKGLSWNTFVAISNVYCYR
jgi:hypothetical protein